MNYLRALEEYSHRRDPRQLRQALAAIDVELARPTLSAKARRRRERRREVVLARLRAALALQDYDWAAGEDEFIAWVERSIRRPGVYERWRAEGVPAHVLRRASNDARYRPSRRGLRLLVRAVVAVALLISGVALIAVVAVTVIWLRPPSPEAFGWSLARGVGGSALPCPVADSRPTNCWVWDAESSGQARYRVVGADGDCWRAVRISGGIPETAMSAGARGCVDLDDKINAALL